MLEHVLELLQDKRRPSIAVVGDMMLDTYVHGDVSRISPEGPIPVLKMERREDRAGGAGSVAAMLAEMGAVVSVVGTVGRDAAGEAFQALLQKMGVNTDGLVATHPRPTTTKTRFLGYVQSAGRALQQIVRVDEEQTDALKPDEARRVTEAALDALEAADLIILQDMGKGLLDAKRNRALIQAARKAGKPVVVDPERTEDYAPYRGATCVLPNRFETERATGRKLRTEDDYRAAAEELLQRLELDAAVVKLDREGMYLATREGERRHMRIQARQVADVTGAGDMVASALSYALALGADYPLAVSFANFAGGLEVGQVGVTAIGRQTMLDALSARSDPALRKIKDREDLARLREELARQGRSVAFTNGCFDLLHLGHTQLIRHARAQADLLVVGINTDRSVRELKGPERPINDQDVRARMLAALEDVDYVVMFDEKSVLPLIRELRPDVLVKGGDYDKAGVVGANFVESYGGRVELAPEAEGFSTTDLIERIAGESG
jgi:D-beta-D-heptose 7-phosphate kinase/D-beta-D-heptose 1-phosphate adenosyltransferase